MKGKCRHESFWLIHQSAGQNYNTCALAITICSGRHYWLQKLNGESAKMNKNDICLLRCLLLLICVNYSQQSCGDIMDQRFYQRE